MEKTFNINHIPVKDYKHSMIIKDLLQKNHWREVNGQASYSNKNTQSTIKSYLDGCENIFLKHKLAEKFKDFYFINPFYTIDKDTREDDLKKLPYKIYDDGFWFLKPSDLLVGSGNGVKIIKFKKGDVFRNFIRENINKKYSYILQRNISPPALINGYKFDLRIIGLIIYTPDEFATYMLDINNIKYSIKKYDDNDEPDNYRLMSSFGNVQRMSDDEKEHLIDHEVSSIFDSSNEYYQYMPAIRGLFSCLFQCVFEDIKQHQLVNRDYGYLITSLDVAIDYYGRIYILEFNNFTELYDHVKTVEEAYADQHPVGLNNIIFKDFYKLVFESIINNKLKNHDYGNWTIANYYTFDSDDEISCFNPMIQYNDLSLYKFSYRTKDIISYFDFVEKQPLKHLSGWGDKYKNMERLAVNVALNYTAEALHMGIFLPDKLIGIVGMRKASKTIGTKKYHNDYFCNILIDHKHTGYGYGYLGMIYFIDYVKSNSSYYENISNLYASIYKNNNISISLHEKVGFKTDASNPKVVVLKFRL